MITKKLLKRLNLTQKNDRVFFAINNHSYFSMNDLKLLKKAINKSVKLFRVCLHKDTSSQIQEMIICHIIPQKIGPLKQKKECSFVHVFERFSVRVPPYCSRVYSGAMWLLAVVG